jgi:hypothetical protein
MGVVSCLTWTMSRGMLPGDRPVRELTGATLDALEGAVPGWPPGAYARRGKGHAQVERLAALAQVMVDVRGARDLPQPFFFLDNRWGS